jgi:hypothetical protein
MLEVGDKKESGTESMILKLEETVKKQWDANIN